MVASNSQDQFIACGRTSAPRRIRRQGKGDVAGIIERRRIGSIQVVGIGGKGTTRATVVPGTVRAAVDDTAQRSIAVDTNRLVKAGISSCVGTTGGGIYRDVKSAGIGTSIAIRIGVRHRIGRTISSIVRGTRNAGTRKGATGRCRTQGGQVQWQCCCANRLVAGASH
ncbi:MAG: hypothetical protein EPGJADBJ_04419 [Saprospiraceae bacterium]|nr:hypothetical protein [Saprospiraceae bacterium]